MVQVENKMIVGRPNYNVKSDIIKRVIADQRLRHDFNVCQRLPRNISNPSKDELKRNQEAVVMLALIASAYMFVDELPKELENAGMYKHGVKRTVNRIEPILKKASRKAEDTLRLANNGKTSTGYFDCMDAFYAKIDDSIKLPPPERAFNIIIAMCRLIGSYSRKLVEYHALIDDNVTKIPSILSQVPIQDYQLDNIIDLTVRPIVFDIKY